MTDIRKISVGAEYKNAMHYIVGQKVLGETGEIYHIKHNQDSDSLLVYIINEKNEVLLWKEFRSSVPVSIEFNINY
jgi:ribosomal protein S4E